MSIIFPGLLFLYVLSLPARGITFELTLVIELNFLHMIVEEHKGMPKRDQF